MIAVCSLALGVAVSEPVLLPVPAKVVWRGGAFAYLPDAQVRYEGDTGALRPHIHRFFVRSGKGNGPGITLRRDAAMANPEAYAIEIAPDGVTVRAGGDAGFYYAAVTFRQILPTTASERTPVQLPLGVIEDEPRFRYRGMHLDVARHFLPKAFILKFLDTLAEHKFNHLHWHLTDDQGWRLQIRRYPKLTQVGGWRKETMRGHYRNQQWDGTRHGGFYTQADVREIVRYAADRHITIVPEIEMPGHAQAAIAAYPELGNLETKLPVATSWGVIENVFNVELATMQFLRNVLDEVVELFPSPYIHVGGDECPKKQWKESAKAQARMKELGLKNEDELQSWFIRQTGQHLAKRGRRLIGWDEIREGGLAPGAIVMSWRGMAGGIAAAKEGHDVIMSPNDFTYFDYYQSKDTTKEPLAIGGYLPLDKVYAFDPIPPELSPAESGRVLGGQGQIWTEYIPDGDRVEYMAFPRACALAEVLWSPATGRSWDDFSRRLPMHLDRLTARGVKFRRLEGGRG